jgi:hypothetical protein
MEISSESSDRLSTDTTRNMWVFFDISSVTGHNVIIYHPIYDILLSLFPVSDNKKSYVTTNVILLVASHSHFLCQEG